MALKCLFGVVLVLACVGRFATHGAFINVICPTASTNPPCQLYSVPDAQNFTAQNYLCDLPYHISWDQYPQCAMGYDQDAKTAVLYCVYFDDQNTTLYSIDPTAKLANNTCTEVAPYVEVVDGKNWQPDFYCMTWSSLLQKFILGESNAGELYTLDLEGNHEPLALVCANELNATFDDEVAWISFADDDELLYFQCTYADFVCVINILTNATSCGPVGQPNSNGEDSGASYNFEDGLIYVELAYSDNFTTPCLLTVDTDTLTLTLVSCSNANIVDADNVGGFTYVCSLPDDPECGEACSITYDDCTENWQTCTAANKCVCKNTPKTTCTTGFECGVEDNTCGANITCGTCSSDETCESDHTCDGGAAVVPYFFLAAFLGLLLLLV